MAPFPGLIHGLSDPPSSGSVPRAADESHGGVHPEHQIVIIKQITVVFSAISMLADMFALYWLIRMRRSFRHDLIMLLILSDAFKSLWFLLFPLVDHANGPVSSSSTFCQVSGYFLAAGMESSDVAVFFITLHSALYIFRPKAGLYPYRRLAYAFFLVFPLFIAALAYIDGLGYRNTGHICSPSTKGWNRISVNWIPRYAILLMIIVIYVSIYAYVRSMMFHYEEGANVVLRQSSDRRYNRTAPSTQTVDNDQLGLISSIPCATTPITRGVRDRGLSVSTTDTAGFRSSSCFDSRRGTPTSSAEQYHNPVNWHRLEALGSALPHMHVRPSERSRNPTFPGSDLLSQTPPSHPPSRTDSTDGGRPPAPAIAVPSPTYLPPRSLSTSGVAGHDNPSLSTTLAEDSADNGRTCHPYLLSALRKGSQGDRQDASTLNSAPGVAAHGSLDADLGMPRNRDRILRQLRSLFVYPLAYMLTWIFPFVGHVLGYYNKIGPVKPFWLLIVSMICLGSQGFVDAAVFLVREEPWKHIGGGFWESLRRQLRVLSKARWKKGAASGRTREEMLVDVRDARARRKKEIAIERQALECQASTPRARAGRNWWDIEFDEEGSWAQARGQR